jgi:hypothetical protein
MKIENSQKHDKKNKTPKLKNHQTHRKAKRKPPFYPKGKAKTTDDVRNNKGKGVPLHAMEALEGRGGIAPTHT